MINKRINLLRKKFNSLDIDGYIIPKNDDFFSEYSKKDRLKVISNFTGSAGFAIILKKKNYLFVDGRYTIQAKIESGKFFKIVPYEKIFNCALFKNLTIGIDPTLFTSRQISNFFLKYNNVREIETNLIDTIFNKYLVKTKPFFSLDKSIIGEGHKDKIRRVSSILKKNKINYIFITAPENVAWLLNIRGHDNPNSPIPNCRLLMSVDKKIFLICEINKAKRLIREKKITQKRVINPKKFNLFLDRLKIEGNIITDSRTCSIFYENIIKNRFKMISKEDPIYLLKSIKNPTEINNMISSHIIDGVALTKFIYWIKILNNKRISEVDAQNKLEKFRKKSKDYLFPSFNTIAGAGKNGAIIHYRARKENTKTINKNDIFLCDSGGQYKYGTTDVTRTFCFSNPKKYIKNIFTKVLKGHIAVATSNLKTHFNGKLIDIRARKYLKKSGLDYAHGTGHGVGFFSNVHEGPQAISKFNSIRLKQGMILSNEPGFYKKDEFGIRIENLIYVKKYGKKLFFENLTLAPIDKELINFKLLSQHEQNYLFNYHLNIYSKLSKYLNKNEKKWLTSFF